MTDQLADRYSEFAEILEQVDIEALEERIRKLTRLRDTLLRLRGATVDPCAPVPPEPVAAPTAPPAVPEPQPAVPEPQPAVPQVCTVRTRRGSVSAAILSIVTAAPGGIGEAEVERRVTDAFPGGIGAKAFYNAVYNLKRFGKLVSDRTPDGVILRLSRSATIGLAEPDAIDGHAAPDLGAA